jgi:hypothetical protein
VALTAASAAVAALLALPLVFLLLEASGAGPRPSRTSSSAA